MSFSFISILTSSKQQTFFAVKCCQKDALAAHASLGVSLFSFLMLLVVMLSCYAFVDGADQIIVHCSLFLGCLNLPQGLNSISTFCIPF